MDSAVKPIKEFNHQAQLTLGLFQLQNEVYIMDKNQRKLQLQTEMRKIQSEIHTLTGGSTSRELDGALEKARRALRRLRALMREHDLL